jgi:hypothetical protein
MGSETVDLGAATRAVLAQFDAGLMYFNVHTSTFPGGEIRGQILPLKK